MLLLDDADLISRFRISDDELTQEVTDALKQLWQDHDVQEVFEHRARPRFPTTCTIYLGRWTTCHPSLT
jgi:hypothetical protein